MATMYEKFKELQANVNNLEPDFLKTDKGNAAAGRRVRAAMRDLRDSSKQIAEMTKTIGTNEVTNA